ncbi:hypothetical protein CR513_02376, partial [Mucuna pruriens]
MTARTKIDVYARTLLMEFEDTFVKFNSFEALKHPAEDNSIFSIDSIVGSFDSNKKESQQAEAESDSGHSSPLSDRVDQSTPSTQENYVSPQPQTIELKSLPEHLKYAYLGDNQQFPVIIANNLSREQEEKLLEVLKRHKKAID